MDYRKCDVCKNEYTPQREAQSYCSPRCRRAAAYGRERFQSETRGARKRILRPRVEASDTSLFIPRTAPETLSARVVAGSFRNGPFSSIEAVPCRAPLSPISGPIDVLGGKRRGSGVSREISENILWCEVGPLSRLAARHPLRLGPTNTGAEPNHPAWCEPARGWLSRITVRQ